MKRRSLKKTRRNISTGSSYQPRFKEVTSESESETETETENNNDNNDISSSDETPEIAESDESEESSIEVDQAQSQSVIESESESESEAKQEQEQDSDSDEDKEENSNDTEEEEDDDPEEDQEEDNEEEESGSGSGSEEEEEEDNEEEEKESVSEEEEEEKESGSEQEDSENEDENENENENESQNQEESEAEAETESEVESSEEDEEDDSESEVGSITEEEIAEEESNPEERGSIKSTASEGTEAESESESESESEPAPIQAEQTEKVGDATETETETDNEIVEEESVSVSVSLDTAKSENNTGKSNKSADSLDSLDSPNLPEEEDEAETETENENEENKSVVSESCSEDEEESELEAEIENSDNNIEVEAEGEDVEVEIVSDNDDKSNESNNDEQTPSPNTSNTDANANLGVNNGNESENESGDDSDAPARMEDVPDSDVTDTDSDAVESFDEDGESESDGELDEGMIANPFYAKTNVVKDMSLSELYSSYPDVLIICHSDGFKITGDTFDTLMCFSNKVVDENTLKNSSKNMKIIRTGPDICRVKKHLGKVVRLERKVLNRYFPKEKFEMVELVLPLQKMNYTAAVEYTSLYRSNMKVEVIKRTLETVKHHNPKKEFIQPGKLVKLFKEIDNGTDIDCRYWQKDSHCRTNITSEFNNRSDFGKKKAKVSDPSSYIDDRYDANDKRTGALMKTLRSQTNRSYYVKTPVDKFGYNKNSVVEIYKCLTTQYEKYELLNELLVSKQYCHLVLNNKELLKLARPLMEKHSALFKYTFAYAWSCMIHEEEIMRTRSSKENSRFSFDIDTASELPVFFTDVTDPHQNPYITMLVDSKDCDFSHNLFGLYGIADRKYYGICTSEEFIKRLKLFISGDEDNDLLEGLDWSKFSLSGSIVTACAQKKSPLTEKVASPDLSEDDKHLTYQRAYNSTSDVDMMTTSRDVFEFMKSASHVLSVLKSNIVDYEEGDINVKPIKQSMIIVTDAFIEKHYDAIKIFLFDQDDDNVSKEDIINMIKTCHNEGEDNSKKIIPYLHEQYFLAKMQLNDSLSKHFSKKKRESDQPVSRMVRKLMRMFLSKATEDILQVRYIEKGTDQYKRHQRYFTKGTKPETAEVCCYVNDGKDTSEQVPDDKNDLLFKITECIRLQFTSPKMMRCIELFSTQYDDPYSLVARFHFACVRGYVDGYDLKNAKVFFLASCVSSLMTGLNPDSKYFSAAKPPGVAFDKYLTRGFGTYCNKKELQHIINYNRSLPNDSNYKINTDEEEEAFLRPKKLDHKVFLPLSDFDVETLRNPDLPYIESADGLIDAYQKEYDDYNNRLNLRNPMLNMFNIKHINDKGFMIPYQPWVKDAYWNVYGKYMTMPKQDKKRFGKKF